MRFLQLPLSCLGQAVWYHGPSPDGGDDSSLLLNEVLRLRRANMPPLFFEASQRFKLIADPREGFEGEWKSNTLAYVYAVGTEQGVGGSEILSWHWHPLTTPDRPDPHVHVRADDDALPALRDLHIPSGRVAFEEVVLFLIRDLRCVAARDDYEDVLNETLTRFRAYRTWS